MKLEEYLQQHYSPRATPGYLNLINRFTGYMGTAAVTAAYKDVLNYIGHLRKLQLHPKSLRNHLFAIKIYYRYLNETGKRKDHPCQHLYLKDQVNKRIQVESLYSMEILEELLKQHKAKRKYMQKRDEVLISLLIYQALLVTEISQLNMNDVNLNEGTIRVNGNIKNKGRTLSLKSNQIMLLHQYITEERPKLLTYNRTPNQSDQEAFILTQEGTRIYPSSVNRIINQGKAKYEKLTPLKIRQSVIAHLLKSNNDLRVVQVFAGHRRAGSTEEYKQTGLEELKTLIQKLHPLEKLTNPNPHNRTHNPTAQG